MARGYARVARCLLVVLMLVLVLEHPGGSWAQDSSTDTVPSDWQLLALDAPTTAYPGTSGFTQLFAPTSGALLASSSDELFRSDDGGDTWRAIPLPPPPRPGNAPPGTARIERTFAVDPTNHDLLYSTGAAGLYVTRDAGATWRVALPLRVDPEVEHVTMAVSPANPALIYAVVFPARDWRYLRSQDAGATWVELSRGNLECSYSVSLHAHPTDPQRVFRTDGCGQGAGIAAGWGLSQSTDQGAHWSVLRQVSGYATRGLVGGRGAMPVRWYAVASPVAPTSRNLGASVLRSDDDGVTWQTMFTFAPPGADPPGAHIGKLAYDPGNPDTVYAGLTGPAGGVQASVDAGATWTPLGRPDIGSVRDLVLGVDAQNLYVATDQGLWRLGLGTVLPPTSSSACLPGNAHAGRCQSPAGCRDRALAS